ncbi:MAG: electron transfer flavoprotein subunit alpha [Clostridium sp.]|nr:electron transfer flavoprotein subunit alpha [Clostridium sp.]
MSKLFIHEEKLNDEYKRQLISICPFGAMQLENGKLSISSACKMCKMCVRKGPSGVVEFIDDAKKTVDKSKWKGIAVYVEYSEGKIHPVSFELIGKAQELAKQIKQPVYAIFISFNIKDKAEELLHYGVDKVFVYDYSELKYFTIEPYAAAFTDFISKVKPSSILVGATIVGRSLAPRVAARFKTGLTADCTILDIKGNTDLVQIRPAFGGNIMARIVTPNTRPQFCTVRYKIFQAPQRSEYSRGEIRLCELDEKDLSSNINVIQIENKKQELDISECEVIVSVGRALRSLKDIAMIKEFADLIGGQIAGTRPMVEQGIIDSKRQIGLSGRTVKPKLIINLGISGAIQYVAGMEGADTVISINTDEHAPIFNVSNYGIVGDMYDVIPRVIDNLKCGKKIL